MPGPLQAVYYATKAYVTSWSNALWREVQGTGVTVSPEGVAKAGYEGMIEGKLNITAGLTAAQKIGTNIT